MSAVAIGGATGVVLAFAALASRSTASAALSRPRIAGTRLSATAASAITMLDPVWRAIASAASPARPAGALTATVLASAGEAMAATAAAKAMPAPRTVSSPR